MLSGQVIGVFTVYGSSVHISPTKHLQYQVPWFVQTFVPAISILLSFFIVGSPRWLLIKNKREKALAALCRLRDLSLSCRYDGKSHYTLHGQQSMRNRRRRKVVDAEWEQQQSPAILLCRRTGSRHCNAIG